jgi:hypothetical protein
MSEHFYIAIKRLDNKLQRPPSRNYGAGKNPVNCVVTENMCRSCDGSHAGFARSEVKVTKRNGKITEWTSLVRRTSQVSHRLPPVRTCQSSSDSE